MHYRINSVPFFAGCTVPDAEHFSGNSLRCIPLALYALTFTFRYFAKTRRKKDAIR